MGNSINLDDYAAGCISDALHGVNTLDMDTLREAVQEFVDSAAENACIYTHNCFDIISRYEREVGPVDDMGGSYTAEQWQEAMQAYAYAVASAYISQQVEAQLTEIEEAAEALRTAAESVAGETELDDEPAISTACTHGWAPHAREDEAGVHYWEPGELEGCRAVAIRAGGVWLSYTWNA